MGRIAEVLSFARRLVNGAWLDEVKVDGFGNVPKTVQHYAAPGDDSQPLPGDFTALEDVNGSGEMAAVGYHDTKTERKAQPGERRLYARSGPGVEACEVWLKADGTLYFRATRVVVDSGDIRAGDETASQPIARVGDLVVGSLSALAPQGSPGVPLPLLPVPGVSAPTASGGITFAGQIVSGSPKAKG